MKTSTWRGLLACTALAFLSGEASAQTQTWAERLGWPEGSRVVILHADDVGMCSEANESTKRYLAAGEIQSGAVMVPCPWFEEFAAWYREHPEEDIGLHLTLTSEWKHYRWGPVAPREKVPGLLDAEGYLHKTVMAVVMNAKPEEVEAEVRAQVERALARGIKPGHLDTHMGTLYAHTPFTEAYLKVAVEYEIPAMVIEMTPRRVAQFRKQGYPLPESMLRLTEGYPLPKLDDFRPVPKAKTYAQLKERFAELVRSLEPGITEVIFHPSDETVGLRHILNAWEQRVWEARMFSDPEVKALFEAEGIVFTNWKEMMRRWRAGVRAERREAPPARKFFQLKR